jgi:hypothetical protein
MKAKNDVRLVATSVWPYIRLSGLLMFGWAIVMHLIWAISFGPKIWTSIYEVDSHAWKGVFILRRVREKHGCACMTRRKKTWISLFMCKIKLALWLWIGRLHAPSEVRSSLLRLACRTAITSNLVTERILIATSHFLLNICIIQEQWRSWYTRVGFRWTQQISSIP